MVIEDKAQMIGANAELLGCFTMRPAFAAQCVAGGLNSRGAVWDCVFNHCGMNSLARYRSIWSLFDPYGNK